MIDLKCRSCGEADYQMPDNDEVLAALHLDCPLCGYAVPSREARPIFVQMISEFFEHCIASGFLVYLLEIEMLANLLVLFDDRFKHFNSVDLERLAIDWKKSLL